MVKPRHFLAILQRSVLILFALLVLATYVVCITNLITHQSQLDTLIFYCTAKNFWEHHSIYASICSGNFHRTYVMHSDFINAKAAVYQLGSNYLKNLNSPVFALFLLPWGLISYDLGAVIWHVLIVLSGALGVWFLFRGFFAKNNIWAYLILLELYLASAPAYTATVSAEVGSMFFCAIAAVWYWARKGKDCKAGIALGAILSMKYFFGLVFLLFLWQRRMRLIRYALLSFLFFNGLAWIVFGSASFIQYYDVLRQVSWAFNPWNGSLYGLLAELSAYRLDQNIVMGTWAKMLYYVLAACMVVYQYFLCRRRFVTQNHFDSAFAYTLIIILLISPLAWTYYFPFLMMPLLLIIAVFAAQPLTMPRILSYLFTLLFIILPMNLAETSMMRAQASSVDMTYSGFSLGILLLLALWFYVKNKQEHSVLLIDETAVLPWVLLSFAVVGFSFADFFHHVFYEVNAYV